LHGSLRDFATALPVGLSPTQADGKPVLALGGCRIEEGDSCDAGGELWPGIVPPPEGDLVASSVNDHGHPPAFDQSLLGHDEVPGLDGFPGGGQVSCDWLARFAAGLAAGLRAAMTLSYRSSRTTGTIPGPFA